MTQSPVSHRHIPEGASLISMRRLNAQGNLVTSRPLTNDLLVKLGAVSLGYSARHVLGRLPYTAVEVSGSTPSDLGSSLSIGPVPPQPTGTTAVPGHRTTSEEVGVGTPPGAVGRRRETPSLNQRRTEILKGLPPYRGEPPARRSVSRSRQASLCIYVLEGSLEGLPLTSQCRKPLRGLLYVLEGSVVRELRSLSPSPSITTCCESRFAPQNPLEVTKTTLLE